MASNVAVTSFGDIPASVAADAVQIILCDHHYWGGMRQVQHLAKLAETFNIGLSMHSNSHLGISLMAMAHVAAATPHLTYACDTHYPWQSEKDEVVLGGKILLKDGCVTIPEKPGLGVDLIMISWSGARNDIKTSHIVREMMKWKCGNMSTLTGNECFRDGKFQTERIDMKISKVEAFLMSCPMPEKIELPFWGGVRTILKRDAMLIKVTADNGLIGYAPGPAFQELMMKLILR